MPHNHFPRPAKQDPRFTMIELVLVIALLVVLIAMTVPTLSDVLQSNSIDIASSQTAQHVRLARQHAIAKNRYVAVLAPTAEAADEGGTDDAQYKAKALRLCLLKAAPELQTAGSDSWYEGEFEDYIDDTKWEFLPGGAHVGYTDSFGPFANAQSPYQAHSCNVVSGVLFPTSYSPTVIDNMRALIFRPNGSVLPDPQGGSNTRIRVYNGIVRDNWELLQEGTEDVTFEVNRFTGKVRFD